MVVLTGNMLSWMEPAELYGETLLRFEILAARSDDPTIAGCVEKMRDIRTIRIIRQMTSNRAIPNMAPAEAPIMIPTDISDPVTGIPDEEINPTPPVLIDLLVPENKTRDNINLTTTRESSCCDDQYVARSLHNYSTVKNYLYT